MRLYVVAYPELDPADFELIQEYRKAHDRMYQTIAPHFTLVFAVEDHTLEAFTEEVKKLVAGINEFSFALRCAHINKDSFTDHYFAFLVPDEGFSNIKKLHDKLYSDKLAHHHRLDIDYIPHIEFANATDKLFIKNLVDELNAKDFTITGKISHIDILRYDSGIYSTTERIRLANTQ